jgi:hypothetical protein
LKASSSSTDFQDFADTTYAKAGQLYGQNGDAQQTVLSAWREVGIRVSGVASIGSAAMSRGRSRPPVSEADSLAAISKQIEQLAKQVQSLSKETGVPKTSSTGRAARG